MAVRKPKRTSKQKARAKVKKTAKEARKDNGEARLKSGRLSPAGLPCLCGCGQKTQTDKAKFRMGHDAKLKSQLLKLKKGEKAKVPDVAMPFLLEEGVGGLKLRKKGRGYAVVSA